MIGVLSAGCGKGNKNASKPLLIDYSALRAQVIEGVQNGQITPDKSGIASLPADLDQASSDGQVYLANDGGKLVAFNVTAGKSATADFLLYTKGPLSSDSKTIAVGPLMLMPGRKIDSHWYQARGRLK
ncbi:MAG TPA: hypothetical protein VFC44_13440 [Candidatus Saccharimonadales bacterium]|nr:hypothetical protein [Candidatus Saccharimonadales bacterium]